MPPRPPRAGRGPARAPPRTKSSRCRQPTFWTPPGTGRAPRGRTPRGGARPPLGVSPPRRRACICGGRRKVFGPCRIRSSPLWRTRTCGRCSRCQARSSSSFSRPRRPIAVPSLSLSLSLLSSPPYASRSPSRCNHPLLMVDTIFITSPSLSCLSPLIRCFVLQSMACRSPSARSAWTEAAKSRTVDPPGTSLESGST